MGRSRTGYIEKSRRADGTSYYRARVRLADGTRLRVDVPEKYAYSEDRARLYAAAVQEREDETGELLAKRNEELARQQRGHDASNGETCTMYRERLDAHRKTLGRRGTKDDQNAWTKWIAPHLGHLPIVEVKRENIEVVRDALDVAIALHKTTDRREGISGKRARNVWTVVTTTFSAACTAKRRDLRVREDNP
ncbi:MAG TPA: hypothetical protein VIF62_37565, partial [Labilithrix sp.]